MYSEIPLKTTDGNEKPFKFLSNGMTAYRYQQLFHEDLMLKLSKFEKEADYSLADKLAFVMNCQGEGKDMKTLNIEDFYKWLEQFESVEILLNAEKIVQLYAGSKVSNIVAKKN